MSFRYVMAGQQEIGRVLSTMQKFNVADVVWIVETYSSTIRKKTGHRVYIISAKVKHPNILSVYEQSTTKTVFC